jgi:hypothetical protein
VSGTPTTPAAGLVGVDDDDDDHVHESNGEEHAMGIGDKVKSEGMKLGMKAVGKLMEDPDRATKLMKAIEQVQKGKEAVDETTHRLLNFGQLAAAADVKELSRDAGRVKRGLKKALSLLDDIEAKLEG